MFIEVFLVGILAGMSPGPDFLVVMKNSLSYGRKAGSATALGISSALTIHVGYTILGFAIILQKIPWVFGFIQILGAAYLLWLAWHGIRSAPARTAFNTENTTTPPGNKKLIRAFRDGFLCNILNPKAAVFFLSIFSQFLSPEVPNWVRWVYGLEVIGAVGSWFLILSVLISSRHFRNFYQEYRHWFDRILGGFLLYFACKIIVTVFKPYFYR